MSIIQDASRKCSFIITTKTRLLFKRTAHILRLTLYNVGHIRFIYLCLCRAKYVSDMMCLYSVRKELRQMPGSHVIHLYGLSQLNKEMLVFIRNQIETMLKELTGKQDNKRKQVKSEPFKITYIAAQSKRSAF